MCTDLRLRLPELHSSVEDIEETQEGDGKRGVSDSRGIFRVGAALRTSGRKIVAVHVLSDLLFGVEHVGTITLWTQCVFSMFETNGHLSH